MKIKKSNIQGRVLWNRILTKIYRNIFDNIWVKMEPIKGLKSLSVKMLRIKGFKWAVLRLKKARFVQHFDLRMDMFQIWTYKNLK